METSTTLELIVAFADSSQRIAASKALAERLGVAQVLLFVRDPDLGTFIPAPGFPQTLRGGRSWRSFLARCSSTERFDGEVDLPEGAQRPAAAFVHGSAAVILIGATPKEPESRMLRGVLPLLAALLASEQDALLARAQAVDAAETMNRSQALAAALETARADAALLIAELHEQDQHKDEFLAMLGHELRNPLSALANSIELLKRHGAYPEAVSRPLQIMSRQTGQLSRLVNDLLDVSRVSRGRIELQLENIELEDVLQDSLEENRLLLTERQQIASIELSAPLVIRGDRVRLAQVFGNLINNAAKYTPPLGTVRIRVSADGERALIRVQDSGIGIAPAMLQRIFDLFVQVPTSIEQARGGLGIGLTLTRRLVELHGGQIEATSEGIGRGTTISVRLPLALPDLTCQSICEDPQAIHRELSVLIVDDNEDAADSTAELLRLMGLRVHVAYEGRTSVELAKRHELDLVLLDIGLPGTDGYEVARRLREEAQCAARIVALTGFGDDRQAARSRGTFDDWLIKPLSLETLKALLGRVPVRQAQI